MAQAPTPIAQTTLTRAAPMVAMAIAAIRTALTTQVPAIATAAMVRTATPIALSTPVAALHTVQMAATQTHTVLRIRVPAIATARAVQAVTTTGKGVHTLCHKLL